MREPRQFVKLVNPDTKNLVIINDMEGCRDYITNLPERQQGKVIWFSLKEAFKAGVAVGKRNHGKRPPARAANKT